MTPEEGARERLLQGGYRPVALTGFSKGSWQDIHRWCKEQCGDDNYNWTGSTFWFKREEDAVLFALTWL